MTRTYLDHNATSAIRPEVIEAVNAAMAVKGNPSAQHADGRAANKLISDAREALGLAMGVCAQDIVYCLYGLRHRSAEHGGLFGVEGGMPQNAFLLC